MRARANKKCSILRGTEVDEYGDTVDTLAVVQQHVLFSILEQDRRVYLPAEGATRIVRFVTGRCAPNVDVRKDDRIKVEPNGPVYHVTSLHSVESPVMMPDLTVELSYTN